MEACLPPQIKVDHFDANLSALRVCDAALAQRLSRVRVPPTVQPTVAHDGTATFRIRTGDAIGSSDAHWLGGSGAPAVRAQALCNLFEPGPGNAIVIGIRHGRFVQRLADRLLNNQAVFVIEDDLLTARLALTVNDLSAHVAAGRLVPIVPENNETPADALRKFLDAHPGYLVPDRLFAWPGAEDATLQSMASAIHQLIAPVEADRATLIQRCRSNAAATINAPGGEGQRLLVATASSSWDTRVWLEQVTEAIRRPGIDVETYSPCRASQRHVAAMADAIMRHKPTACILLDAASVQFGGAIPDGLPVVSWIGSDGTGVDLRQGRGAVFATSKTLADRLVRKGLSADRVAVLPMGLPDSNLHVSDASSDPGATGGLPAGAKRSEFWIVANAADCSEQANGMHLDSHRAVWRALSARLRKAATDFRATLPTSALAQAEKETGVQLGDAGLRDLLERLAADVLWPTYRKLAVCERLKAAAVTFTVVGQGWQQFDSVRSNATTTGPDAAPDRIATAAAGKTVLDFERRGDLRAAHWAAVSRGAAVRLVGEGDFTAGRLEAWLDDPSAVDEEQGRPALRSQVEQLLNGLGVTPGCAAAQA